MVAALPLHADSAAVQKWGCGALQNITFGLDEAGLVRRQQAADANALEASLPVPTHIFCPAFRQLFASFGL